MTRVRDGKVVAPGALGLSWAHREPKDHKRSESQTPVQDQRCQSGPSARNSVIPSEGDFSKNSGADQQRLQISDLHFDKFPTPATFACWKMRFKIEVCIWSQILADAMLWIKDVECENCFSTAPNHP